MRVPGCITFFLLILLIGSCSQSKSGQSGQASSSASVPEQGQELDSLTVYTDIHAPDTVTFQQEAVFESGNDVYIDGYIGEMVVDKRGRVFITSGTAGDARIYVFDKDGGFITSLGRGGRGPGEFVAIMQMRIRNDMLYVHDSRQYKIAVFSLKTMEHVKDLPIKRDLIRDDAELAPLSATGRMIVGADSSFVMGFRRGSLDNLNHYKHTLYYRISGDGMIQPGRVLKTRRLKYYMAESNRNAAGRFVLPRTMPFSRSALISAGSDRIYTAWTEAFLIKVYDLDGNYQRAFYYPYQNAPLDADAVDIGDEKRELFEGSDHPVPESWPALHHMTMDDRERLWAFTITESDSTYKGWVLDKQGALLADFRWPAYRDKRNPRTEPFFNVYGDYLYTHTINVPKGIDKVVKHRIEFKGKEYTDE